MLLSVFEFLRVDDAPILQKHVVKLWWPSNPKIQKINPLPLPKFSDIKTLPFMKCEG